MYGARNHIPEVLVRRVGIYKDRLIIDEELHLRPDAIAVCRLRSLLKRSLALQCFVSGWAGQRNRWWHKALLR